MKYLRSPVYLYRIARYFYLKKVPVLPSLIFYFIRWWFCCSLPFKSSLGARCELGQGGMGCVIHSTAVLGDDCHLGTHVTIGGNGTELGAPKLGDHVYVGTGAKILGPIVLGNNVIVGANAVVLQDIPDGSLVVGIPGKIVKSGIVATDFLYHKRID